VAVNVSLSCVFGCPMEGDVPEADVFGWVQRFADVGVRGITLCDTTGMAYPTQVHRLTVRRARWPGWSSPCISTTRAAWGWPMCWPPLTRGRPV
jgi:hypothetical protein